MRVSQYFNLGLSQGQVDFVDVPVDRDARLFVDPTAIRYAAGPMRDECVSLLQSFFDEVIGSIRRGDDARARRLLVQLSEPSETRLGYAGRGSHGLGVGSGKAVQIWRALRDSEAVKTGLLQDLEETALVIDGIDVDIVSDIATNIIRGPLIRYTQAMAHTYGVPLETGVASGPCWDGSAKRWQEQLIELPMTRHGRVVLVPKLFVRRGITYSATDYYTHYILANLQAEHIAAGSALVHILKSGRRRVYKKDLKKQYPQSKALILAETLKHPELLQRYRRDKRQAPKAPVSPGEFVDRAEYDSPEWTRLLEELRAVPVGAERADEYHQKAFGLLTALFAPHLTWPEKEVNIHDGRKRIDIVFTNGATEGFFSWVAEHYGAPYIMVECKNYTGDPANPELDQLAGRFSPRRGRFGILACRSFRDRARFVERCRDTAADDRGYIIALEDSDLEELVAARQADDTTGVWRVLREKFNALVM